MEAKFDLYIEVTYVSAVAFQAILNNKVLRNVW